MENNMTIWLNGVKQWKFTVFYHPLKEVSNTSKLYLYCRPIDTRAYPTDTVIGYVCDSEGFDAKVIWKEGQEPFEMRINKVKAFPPIELENEALVATEPNSNVVFDSHLEMGPL